MFLNKSSCSNTSLALSHSSLSTITWSLSNPSFLNNAKSEVVQEVKKDYDELVNKLKSIQGSIDRLS